MTSELTTEILVPDGQVSSLLICVHETPGGDMYAPTRVK